jgi:hypothetical protein
MEVLHSKEFWFGLTAFSIVCFVGTLVAIPFILVRLPPHYFDERRPRTWMKDHHPVLRLTGLALKNVVGIVFVLAGVAMLFLPGQGILTMLIGLSLMDFPGKRRLERMIVGQPEILRTINGLRARFGRAPLTVSDAP